MQRQKRHRHYSPATRRARHCLQQEAHIESLPVALLHGRPDSRRAAGLCWLHGGAKPTRQAPVARWISLVCRLAQLSTGARANSLTSPSALSIHKTDLDKPNHPFISQVLLLFSSAGNACPGSLSLAQFRSLSPFVLIQGPISSAQPNTSTTMASVDAVKQRLLESYSPYGKRIVVTGGTQVREN